MKRNIIMVAACLAAIMLAVVIWTITNQAQYHSQPISPCPEYLTVGPDGHYLLNRSLTIPENADAINHCLRQAGINNVHIVKNLSDLTPSGVPS